ncbi:class I SAM-dependent methyltransferase [Cognatilysobacter lacus]|uniref:Methyltransferase domain-containing protein n=1 Tax=Cognatilysobacter lacus TaxID=1643323 RepID=A0A5D8Z995_9GAMM|nr:class I SAM-dependent methyltransferase [Lysobacter lacus]TZF91227.1 methyltransferase domain-containing protein [Lysobacter lacus]
MPDVNAQYNVAKPGSLPVRLATRQRRVMYERFLALQKPQAGESILDVGATSDDTYESSNYLESWYPDKGAITACGIDDASFLEQKFPGMRFVRADGRDLPFADESFDIVHSSAVLEHVGSNSTQQNFVRELIRVAKRGVFLTTPNRWFPVEFHSVLPIVHWLPAAQFRAILRLLGHRSLDREENLNLLTPAQVAAMCARLPRVRAMKLELPTLFGWPSNIVCSMEVGGPPAS